MELARKQNAGGVKPGRLQAVVRASREQVLRLLGSQLSSQSSAPFDAQHFHSILLGWSLESLQSLQVHGTCTSAYLQCRLDVQLSAIQWLVRSYCIRQIPESGSRHGEDLKRARPAMAHVLVHGLVLHICVDLSRVSDDANPGGSGFASM